MVFVFRLLNKEGFISIGKIKYVFLLYIKVYCYDEYGKLRIRELVLWYRYIFYFIVRNILVELLLGSIDDKMGFFIDDLLF